jgi:hypothetical protein
VRPDVIRLSTNNNKPAPLSKPKAARSTRAGGFFRRADGRGRRARGGRMAAGGGRAAGGWPLAAGARRAAGGTFSPGARMDRPGALTEPARFKIPRPGRGRGLSGRTGKTQNRRQVLSARTLIEVKQLDRPGYESRPSIRSMRSFRVQVAPPCWISLRSSSSFVVSRVVVRVERSPWASLDAS